MKYVFTAKTFAILSVVVIFIIDFFVPPGTAMGILYLVSMTLVFNENKKTIIVFAVATSLLTVTDTILQIIRDEANIHNSIYDEDRALSILAIWLSCFVLLKYRKLNEEKEKRQQKHIESLKVMIFMTSHEVRRPIAHILGLSNVLDDTVNSPEELKKIIGYIKQSALDIDKLTHELNLFIQNSKDKAEVKN